MAHKKKKSFYKKPLFLISFVLVLYLKIRDYISFNRLTCGLDFHQCTGVLRFIIEFFLWIVVLFAILFLLVFFIKAIIWPEKHLKFKLFLKKANDQAHKKVKKKKRKKKELKKAKKEEELTEQEEESQIFDDVEQEAEEAVQVVDKEQEVIRI